MEVRAARQGLPLPRVRRTRGPGSAVVDDVDRRTASDAAIRHSAARRGSATSSTRGSRTCRSCQAGARGARLRGAGRRIRSTTPTRWSRCRMRRRASSATSIDADADRPFVEVSGRKGLGVKADDLIDRLTDKAAAEVVEAQSRAPAGPDPPDRGSRSPSPRCATSW